MTVRQHDQAVQISALEHTRWAVLWIDKRGKRREHKPGSEFPGVNFVDALELYEKVKASGRKGITLRCTNVGFPPPDRYMPRIVRVKIRGSGRKPRYKEVMRYPLKKLNRKGIWWCPYCMKLRRFKRIVNRYTKAPVDICPMCEVPHYDHNVKAHNPIAQRRT